MKHPEDILEEIEKVQDRYKLELGSVVTEGGKIWLHNAEIIHDSCCRAVNELVSQLAFSKNAEPPENCSNATGREFLREVARRRGWDAHVS